MVRPGEKGERMAEPDMVKKVVSRKKRSIRVRADISFAGNSIFPMILIPTRLEQDIQYPEDCIEVLRPRPFLFSARSCDRWSQGRVILCGDSAHVFPPCLSSLLSGNVKR